MEQQTKFDGAQLEVRRLGRDEPGALAALVDLFALVFDEPPQGKRAAGRLERVLAEAHFVALAAFYQGELVGGLTAYVLPGYASGQDELLVYDLAVRPDFQRLGVGKRLLAEVRVFCDGAGIGEFFVLAHVEDEHALAFYRAAGGRGEEVVNFVFGADGE